MVTGDFRTATTDLRELRRYNYEHFWLKHLLADLVRTARGEGVEPGPMPPRRAPRRLPAPLASRKPVVREHAPGVGVRLVRALEARPQHARFLPSGVAQVGVVYGRLEHPVQPPRTPFPHLCEALLDFGGLRGGGFRSLVLPEVHVDERVRGPDAGELVAVSTRGDPRSHAFETFLRLGEEGQAIGVIAHSEVHRPQRPHVTRPVQELVFIAGAFVAEGDGSCGRHVPTLPNGTPSCW